ncbi:mitochondrial glyco protein [Rhizodiscina lignyota]|uniref:Mitochondrial glyco protein n=1 Tax=Rhizodiscina lignyota TaxID=1504668 RepID=A0A9P4IK51_9PEZI|nr:mitochondrial glyco protein [Rhizodiscina lignyota]
MLSLRSIARSAPRTTSRLAIQSARPSISAFRNTARLQAKWTPFLRVAAAPFSTSMRRFDGNEELIAKLDSEIKVEQDIGDPETYRGNVREFIENGPWELQDEQGSQEVKLSRTYNDEKIEISFSVADIASIEPSSGMNDPDAAYDDAEYDNEPEVSAQSGGANTKGSVNQGRTSGGNVRVAPEDRVAPADRPELDDEEGDYGEGEQQPGASFPVRLLIKITKDSQPGAMEIEAIAQDGEMMIESVFFYPQPDLADPQTAEGEFKRRMVYAGPRYDNLDVELQDLMDQFLRDRNIDTELSLWLPDFVDYKEQKEYVGWLHNVKNFLS